MHRQIAIEVERLRARAFWYHPWRKVFLQIPHREHKTPAGYGMLGTRQMPMFRMISMLLACGIGVFLGYFLSSHSDHSRRSPIPADLCFVSQNLNLFDNRQFLSSAVIAVSMHGEVLVGPQCLESGVPFTSTLTPGEERNALDTELESGGVGVVVPITFVGVAHIPSRAEYLYDSMRYKLGIKDAFRKPVTIVRLIAVGKASHKL